MIYEKNIAKNIRQAFVDDGVCIFRGLMGLNEIEECRKQWDSVREDLALGREKNGVRRDGFYIHGRFSAPIGEIPRNEKILDIVKILLGSDNIAVYLSRINIKDKKFSDSIHLHQDLPYFNGGVKKLGVFLALKPVNLNNGAMVFVPGSQKLGVTGRETLDIALHSDLDVIIPSLQPGDVIFADINLWHASVPNSNGEDRPLLQTIYQPANDGSYYPDSISMPWLVAGEWETNEFSPWKSITSSTCYHNKTYIKPVDTRSQNKNTLFTRLRSYFMR